MHSRIIAICHIPLSYGKGIWFKRCAYCCWLCIRIYVNVVFAYVRNSIINRWTRLIMNIKREMDRSVYNSVWTSVWSSVDYSVWNSVYDSVNDLVYGSVRNSVRDSVWNAVWGSVRVSVSNSVDITVKEYEYSKGN